MAFAQIAIFYALINLLVKGLILGLGEVGIGAVPYTHLRAHETRHDLVCRLLLEKKKKKNTT
ncbi:hypothetical protein HpBGD16_15110 [Helicobacter pylori]